MAQVLKCWTLILIKQKCRFESYGVWQTFAFLPNEMRDEIFAPNKYKMFEMVEMRHAEALKSMADDLKQIVM